jgi:hypothetical protein
MRKWVLVLVVLAACGGNDAPPPASSDSTAAAPSSPGAAADSMQRDTSDHPVGSGANTPPPANAPTISAVRGKVVASGAENMNLTTLQVSAGPMVVLTGSLEPELRALAGATVLVGGPEKMENNRRIVEVTGYDVLDINGERPVVGTLLGNSKLLRGTDTLTYVGDVKAPNGSKVWITGDQTGKQIKVRSYGVIR